MYLPAAAVDFLEKPFHMSTFEAKIEDLLQGHARIRVLQGIT